MVYFSVFWQSKTIRLSCTILSSLTYSAKKVLVITPSSMRISKQKEWKRPSLIFTIVILCYFGWKQLISLPTHIPNTENLLSVITIILENIFLPWNLQLLAASYQKLRLLFYYSLFFFSFPLLCCDPSEIIFFIWDSSLFFLSWLGLLPFLLTR